ncbi:MAG: glycosyltransferase [Limnochordaceae bacterium]|nr:glycosyltransferase [Limnochordaceae bacterium]
MLAPLRRLPRILHGVTTIPRALVIGTGFGGWFAGFERAVLAALRRAGVMTARTSTAILLDGLAARDGWDAPAPWDLVLVLGGERLDAATARSLRRLGRVVAAWVTEDPYTIDRRPEAWAGAFDVVFTNERMAVDRYGPGRGVHLPWCTDPQTYRPERVGPPEELDVVFVGSGFPHRVRLLNGVADLLATLRVELVGPWDRWDVPLDPRLRRFVRPPTGRPEAEARLYSRAAITLNVHRLPGPHDLPENLNASHVGAVSPNNRTFDVAACGGFQLVDDTRADLPCYFRPGEEIEVFRGPEDLAAKLRHYLGRPQLRRAMAQRARRRVLAEHTYDHRIRRMLRIVASLGARGREGAEHADRLELLHGPAGRARARPR